MTVKDMGVGGGAIYGRARERTDAQQRSTPPTMGTRKEGYRTHISVKGWKDGYGTHPLTGLMSVRKRVVASG